MPRKRTTDRTTRRPGEPKPEDARERPAKDSTLIRIRKGESRQWQFPRLKKHTLRKMEAEDKKRRKKAFEALTATGRKEFLEKLNELDDNAVHYAVNIANRCLASGRVAGWGKAETHLAKAPFIVDFIAQAKAPGFEGGKPSKFSVPALLALDLEGKWLDAYPRSPQKAKKIQAKLRVKVLEALRAREPEKFKNIAWLESKGVYTGAQEAINLAERKYHYTGQSPAWPSVSKSLQWIASGKPYPAFAGTRQGQPLWRDRKVSIDQRLEALEAMSRHPDKRDFEVIEGVLREVLKKRNREAAHLLHACHSPIYYNHELMTAEQRNSIANLLREIGQVARKRGPKKFPVFQSTLMDLLSELNQPVYEAAKEDARRERARADTREVSESDLSTN